MPDHTHPSSGRERSPSLSHATLTVGQDPRFSGQPYTVAIGLGAVALLPSILATLQPAPDKILVFVDSGVPDLMLDAYIQALQPQQPLAASPAWTVALKKVPAGESSKSLASYVRFAEETLHDGVSRASVVVAVGGGVVGDLVGFLASTLLRGLRFIQCPTTLLAAVDSAIGGKTGVNTSVGKNLVGTFHHPIAVVCDTHAFSSLPRSALCEGYAEIVKAAVISTPTFFSHLESLCAETLFNIHAPTFVDTIQRACSVKAHIVTVDEKETLEQRAALNLGHTFGHAIESISDYRIPHGVAVAIGMVMAMRMAVGRGLSTSSDLLRLTTLLQRIGLPTRWQDLPLGSTSPSIRSFPCDGATIAHAMRSDKKFAYGSMRFVLPRGIGAHPAIVTSSSSAFLAEDWPLIHSFLLSNAQN